MRVRQTSLMTITQRGVNNVEKEQSEEMDFEEIWKPIKSVIEYQRMDYGEAVTIGGQFGILKKEIKSLQQQNKRYRERIEEIEAKNWEFIVQNKRYREALEFYAMSGQAIGETKHGEVARKALEEVNNE